MNFIDQESAKKLYTRLTLIRQAEEAIAEEYPKQEMRCPTHLSIGQEAVPAAIGSVLKSTDYAVSTHRGHAHYLGKGGALKPMIAEIFGKVTGCCRGKGGSMHLIDESVGFMGTTAIVANSIPLGVGLGLAAQLRKTNAVSCIFLGDGATEEGAFYESVNFAVIRKLPVLFMCENNFYSVYSSLKARQPQDRRIHQMAQALGMKTQEVDGNSVLDVLQALTKSVNEIRQGGGPQFIEAYTYRWREHCGPNYDNHIGYRTEEEFETWKKKDPLVIARTAFQKMGVLNEKEMNEIDQRVKKEVSEAFEFARQSEYPPQEEAFQDLYKVVK